MSESSGGIGIGTIIFWIFIMNMFGFCDGDDEKTIEVVIDDKPSVVDQIKDSVSDVKPELERAVNNAKKSFEDAKENLVNQTKNAVKEVKKEKKVLEESKKTEQVLVDKYDSIIEDDDRYKSSENLY